MVARAIAPAGFNVVRGFASSHLRVLAVSGGSLMALMAAAAYVPFAAGQVARASATVTAMTNSKIEVVYGKVTNQGRPQADALVQVADARGHIAASKHTVANGTYRIVLHVKSGIYTFLLRKSADTHAASVKHSLIPGMHLRVSARITQRGFLFLPFFHY